MNDRSNREVFNQVAPGWYNFRHYSIFRTELESMSARWEKGKLLNLGCGHGADFLPFRSSFELFGVDFSDQMILLAIRFANKFEFKPNLQVADIRFLPYADRTFDCAISVATFHHIRSRDEHLASLRELKRVLKPGGEAFITVWNRCQPRFWFAGGETLVPWRVKGKTVYRYYRLFTFWEFEGLVRKAGFKILSSSAESTYHWPLKYFSRNICLLVQS
jgi:tRNA (uracil-5-)-methyltransferase TRM9